MRSREAERLEHYEASEPAAVLAPHVNDAQALALSGDMVPAEHIASRIVILRGQKVMFQLAKQELMDLRSQSVISNPGSMGGRGGRRSLPYAFTEQGVAMLSSVLRSARAIAVNIAIMRAFVRLRELAIANTELARKLDELERRVGGHDDAIAGIVRAIRELAAPSQAASRRRMGFV